jgi:hypothetical protein
MPLHYAYFLKDKLASKYSAIHPDRNGGGEVVPLTER